MRKMPYGLSFLDDALGGILPDDLIVIGAATGIGKTTLAMVLAEQAAVSGKATRLLALERGADEIHMRLVYRRVAQEFFTNRGEFPANERLTWLNFYTGQLGGWADVLVAKHSEAVARELTNLDIIPDAVSYGEWTRKNVGTVYEDLADDSNLVVLDHLHMLNETDEDRGELQAVVQNVRVLRQLIYKHEVPMIVFSHLRKRDRFSKWVIPPLEELHGSSEISKQASAVITIARAFVIPGPDDSEREAPHGATWLRVAKARHGNMACTQYAAMMFFDFDKNAYKPLYFPFSISPDGTELKPLQSEADFEPWMSGARVM